MSKSDDISVSCLKKLVKKFDKQFQVKLSKYYGKSEFYSTGQIKRAVNELGVKKKLIPYVYARYLKQFDYDQITDEENILYAYEYLRERIQTVLDELQHVEKFELLNIRESGIY